MTYLERDPLSSSDLVRVNKVLDLIGRNKTVLDVGCWDGGISQLIAANNNVVCGLENSKNAVQLAKAKGRLVKEFNVEEDNWPSFDIKFDVVFAGEIIEHVFDTDKFLQNIHKVLKDDGALVLTTPNIAALGRRLMLAVGISPLIETTARQQDGGHIRYFTKKTLLNLITDNGFLPIECQSDVVNFSQSGNCYSTAIAGVFPTFGRTLIVKALKTAEASRHED